MTEKEKRKQAVALRYRPDKDASPRVAAKGSGLVAEKIIELARKHGIPVKDDPDLLEVLSKLEIEEEVRDDEIDIDGVPHIDPIFVHYSRRLAPDELDMIAIGNNDPACGPDQVDILQEKLI